MSTYVDSKLLAFWTSDFSCSVTALVLVSSKLVFGTHTFPEAALYGPLLHTSSLIADTPSMLLLLRRDKLLLAEQRYPQAWLLSVVDERIRSMAGSSYSP